MSDKQPIGTLVHYTDPTPLKPEFLKHPVHPLDETPIERRRPQFRVVAALIVHVNDEATGDVCLRTLCASPADDRQVPNALPSRATAGSLEARGCWTPADRDEAE